MVIKVYGKNYKIVLWGLGREYNRHINIIKWGKYQKKIGVVAITAKNVPNIKIIDGWKVISCRQLNSTVSDLEDYMQEEFIQLEEYRKICFVPSKINKWNRKDIWEMDLLIEQMMPWQSVNNSTSGNIALDTLKMLSGEQVYRCEK